MRRFKADKRRSVKKFRRDAGRTAAANVSRGPMRGGYRL